MKLQKIIEVLQEIAPLEGAEDWDNVGLLAGAYDMPVKRIMLAIDLTRPVFTEAQNNRTDLIVAYHPPIWEPVKKVVAGQGPAPLLYEAIRSNMGIYALHTALDVARGGVNDVLAEIVGIAETGVLAPQKSDADQKCKLVVFLSEKDLDKVSAAIFTAGAGVIGEYNKCSFRCRGTGTFEGTDNTCPTVGQAGRFEQADELRLEAVVSAAKIGAVVKAMIEAHSAISAHPEASERIESLERTIDQLVCLQVADKDATVPWESCVQPSLLNQLRRQ